MDFFLTIIHNYYLASAVCGWMVAQLIKIFTGFFKIQEFSVKTMLFGTGGMPSSHTSAICGLCTACAFAEGFGSANFAMSAVLAMVVMIDATSVRRETGKQSHALNLITAELFDGDNTDNDVHFKELIGHSPLQVICGAITGIVTASLLHLIPIYQNFPL